MGVYIWQDIPIVEQTFTLTTSWQDISGPGVIQKVEFFGTLQGTSNSSQWGTSEFEVGDATSSPAYKIRKEWAGGQNWSYSGNDDNNVESLFKYTYNSTTASPRGQRLPASTGSWSFDFIADKEKIYSQVGTRETEHTWSLTSSELDALFSNLKYARYATAGNMIAPTVSLKVTYLS